MAFKEGIQLCNTHVWWEGTHSHADATVSYTQILVRGKDVSDCSSPEILGEGVCFPAEAENSVPVFNGSKNRLILTE